MNDETNEIMDDERLREQIKATRDTLEADLRSEKLGSLSDAFPEEIQ